MCLKILYRYFCIKQHCCGCWFFHILVDPKPVWVQHCTVTTMPWNLCEFHKIHLSQPILPVCFEESDFSTKKLILKRHWGNLFLTKVSNSAQNQVWGSQVCTYNLFTYLFIWKDVTVAIFSVEFSSFTSNNLSILNTFGRHTGLQAMVNNKKLQNYPCLPVPAAPLCNPLAFLQQACHEKHWRAIDHCEFL